MKHLIVAVSLLFLLSITIILSKNNSNSGEISFFSDNIEALSNVENSRQIVCDNFSLTMICQKTCVCGRPRKDTDMLLRFQEHAYVEELGNRLCMFVCTFFL